jgi:hypothetical protein
MLYNSSVSCCRINSNHYIVYCITHVRNYWSLVLSTILGMVKCWTPRFGYWDAKEKLTEPNFGDNMVPAVSSLYVLGSVCFESQPEHLISWLRLFVSSLIPLGKFWDSTSIRPWLLPSRSLLIHCSSIILSFDTTEYGLGTDWCNWTIP